MTEKVNIKIKYKNIEKTLSATPEETWNFLRAFFKDFIPSYKIAEKLRINLDIKKLAKDCEGFFIYSSERPFLIKPNKKLTDNETILLWLLAYHLGTAINATKSENVSKEFLQRKIKKSGKITSTRLNELLHNDLVKKVNDCDYALTDLGIILMQKDFLPKIKFKYISKNR